MSYIVERRVGRWERFTTRTRREETRRDERLMRLGDPLPSFTFHLRVAGPSGIRKRGGWFNYHAAAPQFSSPPAAGAGFWEESDQRKIARSPLPPSRLTAEGSSSKLRNFGLPDSTSTGRARTMEGRRRRSTAVRDLRLKICIGKRETEVCEEGDFVCACALNDSSWGIVDLKRRDGHERMMVWRGAQGGPFISSALPLPDIGGGSAKGPKKSRDPLQIPSSDGRASAYHLLYTSGERGGGAETLVLS